MGLANAKCREDRYGADAACHAVAVAAPALQEIRLHLGYRGHLAAKGQRTGAERPTTLRRKLRPHPGMLRRSRRDMEK